MFVGNNLEVEKKMLFNPGPTNVSENVREAIKTEDICHREPEFEEVILRLNKNIVKLLNGEDTHSAVLFVSSGTGCNEAIINSIEGKVLVVNNGKYSERITEIIENYNIPYSSIMFNPMDYVDIDKIEEAIIKDNDITHIYVVHHETTTGMLTPIRGIGELAAKHNKIFCVDSVSSLGGHPFDLQADNISFCSVSANKCLESFPGVSFVIGNTEAIKNTRGKARSYYFNLYKQWEKEQKGQTPYTPAVQLIFALDAAIKEFVEEGYEKRIERYKELSKKMRDGLQELGFELLLAHEDLQSNVLTSIKIPDGINYWDMHDGLKAVGCTIYSDVNVLAQGKFRIATMGSLTTEDIEIFLAKLEKIMEEMKK